MKKKARRFGLCLAVVHVAGVALTAWYVQTSSSGQAVLVWLYWLGIDFPIGFLQFVLYASSSYSGWVNEISNTHPFLAQMLDSPNIVDGILGTIWWYFVGYYVWKLASGGPRAKSVPNHD